MKYLLPVFLFLFSQTIKASDKDSTIHYNLPDSVKAVQFMAEIEVGHIETKKLISSGIFANQATVGLYSGKKGKGFYFNGHEHSETLVIGLNVNVNEFGYMTFKYDWEENMNYKFLLSLASDSASKTTIIAGYVFLPRENKWKLIGSLKHPFYDDRLKYPAIKNAGTKNNFIPSTINQVWIQRSNGSWKNLKNENLPNPTINWFGHIDSIQQRQMDIKVIEDAMASGKTDVKQNAESVYFTMMKEGTGRLVSVNDTVTAFYKGYLFVNDSIFDQTKDKPTTFPLKRLIRGWQIGVPLCRVGGKIKLVIPSDLAYSIRTRSAKIPPNSILVFEIEVVDAKSGN